jgi:DNA-binding MarR family transcriptional regulator
MSKHVDRLEAADLVTRSQGGDKRRIAIELTPTGRRVLRRVRSHRTAWLAERLGRLDDDELAAVERAIGPLAAVLEQA